MRLPALVVGPVLALLTLEGVSRNYFNYQSVRDPVLGSVAAAGHTFRSRIEGSGVAYHEDHGVRRSPDLGPRSGTRILCLGDSYTEANQVSDAEVYTTLVERSLDRSGMPSAVLNVGRSGFSVADYAANARTFTRATDAAWTVVQVHDLDFGPEAWRTSNTHFRRACATCPIEVVRLDPPPDTAPRRMLRWLRNQSALVGFAMERAQELEGREAATQSSAADTQVVEELRVLAEAYAGRLTLLLVGQFDPADPARDTDAEAVIKRAAFESGISLACSKDEYPALAERGIAPYGFSNSSPNSGHLNAAGHAAAARVVTRELLRLHAEGRL
jgi:hypothetical protein